MDRLMNANKFWLALIFTWPVLLVLGVALMLAGQSWAIGFVTYCGASSVGLGRLALHYYRHGLDNHFCGRRCCGYYQ